MLLALRTISAALLLVGLLAMAVDAWLLAGAGRVVMSFDALWQAVHPASFLFIAELAQRSLDPAAWEVTRRLLELPAPLSLGLLGLGIYAILGLFREPASRRDDSETDRRGGVVRAPRSSGRSDLAEALARCRGAFLFVAVFSGLSNILMLTSSFYMLEVYDRVLPSRSVPTLIALTILVAGLLGAQALLDVIRSRIMVRVGVSLDEALNERVYEAIVRLPLIAGARIPAAAQASDLDNIRSFLSSQGPIALIDLPWMPFYLAIIFAFHPWLGIAALVGAIFLVVLTLLAEALTRQPTRQALAIAAARNGLMEAGRRNAETLIAMGMTGRMMRRWSATSRDYAAASQRTSDIAGGLGSVSRISRMMLQSGILGIGAYLVIRQEATAGIIIAGSILVGRALAPVDLAIANWRGFVAARQSWQRLGKLLELLPQRPAPMQLPAPARSLSVGHASVAPPGGSKLVLQDVTFALEAGQSLGIIGPSGAGKSSLARMLVGAWAPARGRFQIDGATLDQWSGESLGRHVGYLPQGCELFAGTVAENIARFDPDADPEAIVKAAHAAAVHALIVGLPRGYDTATGDAGFALSVGQRQRIGLARALYGDPFLVVLDEPDANLDREGELALLQAIRGVRARRGIAVVITHRQSMLGEVDFLLVLAQGRVAAFGPRETVLREVVRPATQQQEPFRVVSSGVQLKP